MTTIEALKHKIERLEIENQSLRDALRSPLPVAINGLFSPLERITLEVLLRHKLATNERIYSALTAHHYSGDLPDLQIVKVYVCKVRRKLKPFGVEIFSLHSTGYGLTDQGRAALGCLAQSSTPTPLKTDRRMSSDGAGRANTGLEVST